MIENELRMKQKFKDRKKNTKKINNKIKTISKYS